MSTSSVPSTEVTGWRGSAARHRTTAIMTLGVAAALVVIVLLGGGPRTATDLDPDNPGPNGGQALARVLDGQGVEVTVARGAEALEATDLGDDTMVVVTSTELLGRTTT